MMSRGLFRRMALITLAAAALSSLGGCYGVYSYGYVADPCPPPPCGPSYVVVSRPYCPPPPPRVYVAPCAPVYHVHPRW